MKIDINYRFKELDGKEIKETVPELDKKGNPKFDAADNPIFKIGKPFTLRQACLNALVRPRVDPRTGRAAEQINGEEKVKRWKLAERIHDTNGLIDLAVEEITLLKKLVDKKFDSPLTVAQAWDALDPPSK